MAVLTLLRLNSRFGVLLRNCGKAIHNTKVNDMTISDPGRRQLCSPTCSVTLCMTAKLTHQFVVRAEYSSPTRIRHQRGARNDPVRIKCTVEKNAQMLRELDVDTKG